MKHLDKLISDVKQFVTRCSKEFTKNKYIKYSKILASEKLIIITHRYINDITYVDNIMEDIVDMILKEGKFNDISELINDINTYIKTIKNGRYKLCENKQDIVRYMKLRGSLYTMMTEPVFNLFCWSKTKSGSLFYMHLNQNINEILNHKFNLHHYCNESIDYFFTHE